ncbi:hypothetical protein [Marivirga harenae]|uniref:hypothetical protein n=1 Tax=Marivirga harenae TaxID=2010992 RepID=UPI0026DF7871|nr:hypothetical protein [Marivirga harenae]WKV13367.1 hypothetical protein Q3Y49_05940 [Marivirga harenae]|tara:strand:- start:197647 stop:198105 length:459 start_codon:yes stop_codon:yes gene_type:complete
MKSLFKNFAFAFFLTVTFASCDLGNEFDKTSKSDFNFSPSCQSNPDITVLSPNWDSNNRTCPATNLELQVSGGNAPYSWQISGATITRQAGEYIYIKTSSFSGQTYLSFTVTDNCNNSYTLSGTANGSYGGCNNFCDQYPNSPFCEDNGQAL